ncbi:hypothetical protein ACLB2K_050650 [Fragaria x ananassa]
MDLQLSETIIDSASGGIFTTRNFVRTFRPNGFVNDDIMTLVADYLWQERRGGDSFYFTTYFCWKTMQYSKELSLGHCYNGVSTKELGVRRFDNDIPTCKKIFIPMHDIKHWYMLVVRPDVQIAEMWDSLGCSRRQKNQCKTLEKKKFADFTLDEPAHSPKQEGGADCGIFTIKHMQNYGSEWWHGVTKILIRTLVIQNDSEAYLVVNYMGDMQFKVRASYSDGNIVVDIPLCLSRLPEHTFGFYRGPRLEFFRRVTYASERPMINAHGPFLQTTS